MVYFDYAFTLNMSIILQLLSLRLLSDHNQFVLTLEGSPASISRLGNIEVSVNQNYITFFIVNSLRPSDAYLRR